jgi:signal-transduction protein with cAMP-binding, CBS, and nucleotidyltransferase domain
MTKTKKLQDVMSTDLLSLEASTPAAEAARLMRDEGVGNTLVTLDGNLHGIVTDRDLVVRCMAEGLDAATTSLGELCTEELVTLRRESSIGDAVQLMIERAVRRVPVVDGKTPVGIVSLGDLALSQDRESALGAISAAEPNR